MRTDPRFRQVAVGLLLLLIGLGAVSEGAFPALFMIALGAYLLWRQYENNRGGGWPEAESRRYEGRPRYEETVYEREDAPAPREQVYAHALRAVEHAGLNPDEVKVLPVDMGLMGIRKGEDPVIYRKSVLEDVDYIQPFVVLRLPMKATGRIKFEIIDGDGQVLFIHEDYYQLQKGRNPITPASRLPIRASMARMQDWQLRISADGMLLADHTFAWTESETTRLRRQIGQDGEINPQVREALSDHPIQQGSLSLDELLAYQDADEQERRR
jgi:hypothetical protein